MPKEIAKKEGKPRKAAPKTEKAPEKKVAKEKPEKKTKTFAGVFYEATGRRKTSTARVRLFTQGAGSFLVNEKPCENYFPMLSLQQIAKEALEKMKCLDKFAVTVRVKGGGFKSQAEAVRHGISRALVEFNADFRKRLRKAGLLTRDPRMRERKKFGLKRARRAPQWSKR